MLVFFHDKVPHLVVHGDEVPYIGVVLPCQVVHRKSIVAGPATNGVNILQLYSKKLTDFWLIQQVT